MNKQEFYKNCFENLKKELDFSCGALFYKTGKRFFLNYKISFLKEFDDFDFKLKNQSGTYKLKIPICIQNENIGYFLLIKKTPFLNKHKDFIKTLSDTYSEKIKEFEFTNIFKSQLFILQNAILTKDNAAKQLVKKNEELVALDKFRMDFLANISHELRTPLNSIIGFSTALRDEMVGFVNEKQKWYANEILCASIYLLGLINDILDITKLEANAMGADLHLNSPNEIIKEVINIIEPLAYEKNIEIQTRLDCSDKVLLDERKFRQVIFNLTSNAIKFSHPNSKIIISTEKQNNKFLIKIKDFGIGIKKCDWQKIFEKFVQLDNIYSGKYPSSGLGLTISREFLKMQNAMLSFNSVFKKGSEFIIEFNV